jgi:hypothetical protein
VLSEQLAPASMTVTANSDRKMGLFDIEHLLVAEFGSSSVPLKSIYCFCGEAHADFVQLLRSARN